MDIGSYKGCAFQMPDIDDENLATQLAYLENEGAHCGDKGLLAALILRIKNGNLAKNNCLQKL